MKPRKPPNTKRDLFPDTWVVGTAAAELAKNDEGVLLADDPDRVPGSVVEIQPREDTPSPAPVEPRRPIEEELAELRAENERLRRCIAGSRGDLEAMNWRGDDIVTDREGGFFADPGLYRDRGTRRRRRPGAGPRHARIGAALVIAVGIVVGAWLVRRAWVRNGKVGRAARASWASVEGSEE